MPEDLDELKKYEDLSKSESRVVGILGKNKKNAFTFDEFFDLDLKCQKCSKVIFWYLTEANESEICEKMLEAFG